MTSAVLQALALIATGDWDGAHELVQDDPSVEAAWVHAPEALAVNLPACR